VRRSAARSAAVALVAALACVPQATAEGSGGAVDVNGHSMYYECEGRGHPTVVLDAGSPDPSSVWRWVQPAISRFTRVCAYDRAGIGRSARAPAGPRRTAQTQARELRELLRRAHVAGPYVVVGHSWGGLLARLFADDYRRDTAGLVLVDATTFPYLTPAALQHLPRKRTREGIDIRAAVAESAAVTSLGDLPLVVLGSGRPGLDPRLLEAQDAEARLSSDAINAVARRSTHYIQKPPPTGQPDVVIKAVEAVVRAARQASRLPSCRQLFAASAVECRG
jgi:pimeloyl-ACP methyl ester carboxylesterase